MRVGITRFCVVAAIAAVMVLSASTAAWAQSPCTITSPAFTPDFSSNQSCLTLNSSGALATYPGFYPAAGIGNVAPYSNANPAPPPSGVNTVLRLTPNSTDQAGSAMFNTQQQVSSSWTSTFQFQLSGANTGYGPADGFSFIIQNSALTALGPNGCGIGFGGAACTSGTGIPNSVAVKFDTFQNTDINAPNNNYVSIQSCGTGPNTVDSSCLIAENSNLPVTLADGNYHTVAITYTASTLSNCGEGTTNCSILDVVVDGTDLFPGGVLFNMTTIGLANGVNCSNCMAWVGLTAATGGGDDNQDILDWQWQQGGQSGALNTVTPTVLNFNGGTQNNAYDFNLLLTAGGVTSATGTVNPILMDQKSCNKLVQKSFPGAQCFVYENAGIVNGQSVDASVLFELTCADQSGGTCGSQQVPNFFAQLGSDFTFLYSENLGFKLLASTIGPYPGVLKGTGPNPLHPCTPFPNNTPALFQSNQIESFSYTGDPGGKTKAGSDGTGSCWTGTYNTIFFDNSFNELPPGVQISSPKFTTYARNSAVLATYACSTPVTSNDVTNPANTSGPYLTVASCSQSQAPNKNNTPASCSSPTFAGGISCTGGGVDTSTPGLHVFAVTGVDTGGNVNVNAVIYNVK